MANNKKWKFTKKQLSRNTHHKRNIFHISAKRKGKKPFKSFRHKSWFKELNGHVSIRWTMTMGLYSWDKD